MTVSMEEGIDKIIRRLANERIQNPREFTKMERAINRENEYTVQAYETDTPINGGRIPRRRMKSS